MQCAVCQRELTPDDRPLLFDVHDSSPEGELRTGFRIALCPPAEGNNCERIFRARAEKRNLTLVPLIA